ncbi:MAG TPA: DNA gyrase inhibitor YacG [Thermoguttaceae bacterium]
MTILHCPICEKTFDSDQSTSLPFCSQRCKLIDLRRWLDEQYGFPYESLKKEDEPKQEET